MEGRRNDVRWCAAVAAALICFTLLLAGTTLAAGTHDGIIRGLVTDAKNAALEGVVVVVRPGDLTFVTDHKGFFVARGLDPGTYTVEIVAIGFTTATQCDGSPLPFPASEPPPQPASRGRQTTAPATASVTGKWNRPRHAGRV